MQSATYYVIPETSPTSTTKAQAIGSGKVEPGSTLTAGYDFTIPGKHPATDVLFVDGQVTFEATCTVRHRRRDDHGAAAEPGVPRRGEREGLVPERRPQIGPHVAGIDHRSRPLRRGQVRLGKGTFSARVLATTTPVKVNFRWHYLSGGWSGTYSVTPDPVL